ncbi:MAG: HAMP domain-containing protein [Desulfobacteraceae bacterium]|nr:HAMP domain-containing protein [Desulfobacteraceae bacterium]MBC2751390.1 HAMP domain-containing protein [Desulfobacteraceae bacterium]
MKRYLILKLLAIHLVVICFVMVIVWLSIDMLAAGYFVTLMEKYNISPEPAHDMFVSAVHRYLLWAFLGAVTLAVVLSFLMMRRVLAPLSRMSVITREIAAGNFSARVPTGTQDEVGQLARAFNHMAAGLEEIETLRRTLMIDVAHELRTPLTNIRGYLEALNDRVLPFSAETFTLLQNETLRLAELVEDVLQLARADAAHGQLDRQPVDLVSEIKTTLDYFGRAFNEKSVTVNFHSAHESLIIQADRRRMARVLRNLTDNAARYTPAGGAVDIRLDADSRQARIDFVNSAERLVASDLPHLFERFYRGEKSRSRQHGGAGIGLSIVKELVEAHDGQVAAVLIDGRLRIRLTLPTTSAENVTSS